MNIVSVVIVTYQSAKCLGACLDALAASLAPERLQVILVDNASSDATWPLIEAYADRLDLPFHSVTALRLELNRGYAYANNRGLEHAVGDALLLLNPDTMVGPEAIETCMRTIEKTSIDAQSPRAAPVALGVVGCRLELLSGEMDKACRRSFPTLWNSFCHFTRLSRAFSHSAIFARYNLTYLDERKSYAVDCVCGAFMLVTRSAYEMTHGFDEDYFLYGEDIDWCYRIAQAGYAIWYEGSVTTIHVKGGNGGKRSGDSLRHFYETMGLFYRKHYRHRYPAWVLWLVEAGLRVMLWVHVTTLKMRQR